MRCRVDGIGEVYHASRKDIQHGIILLLASKGHDLATM